MLWRICGDAFAAATRHFQRRNKIWNNDFGRTFKSNPLTPTLVALTTMIDERALAINPIVPDSVRHNGQVAPSPFHTSAPSTTPLTSPDYTGNLPNTLPHSLPLRHRSWYPRTRIVSRLPLLPLRNISCQRVNMGCPGARKA